MPHLVIRLLRCLYAGGLGSRFFDPSTLPLRLIKLLKYAKNQAFIRLERTIFSAFEKEEPQLFLYINRAFGYEYVRASGKSLTSNELALIRAVGESIERFHWKNFRPYPTINSSEENLLGPHLSLQSLSGFAGERRKSPSFRFGPDTVFSWFQAMELFSGQRAWCPTQLFSPSHYNAYAKADSPQQKEPILRMPVSTGIAFGMSEEEAVVRALLEIIERDAFMITYLNSIPVPRVDLRTVYVEGIEDSMYDYFAQYSLESHALILSSEFAPYSVALFLIDRTGKGPALSVGAKSDFRLEDAIAGAAEEALAVRRMARVEGLQYRPVPNRESMDQQGRKIFWSKQENLTYLGPLLTGTMVSAKNAQKKEAEVLGLKSWHRKREALLNDISKAASGVYVADMTSSDLNSFGASVVQVLVPELQPLHLYEEFPYVGGNRLRVVPQKLGYVPAKVLNSVPHPFH